MDTIRDVVERNLPIGTPPSVVDHLSANLTERDHQICDNLIDSAQGEGGLRAADIEFHLREAGLSPRPGPEFGVDDQLTEVLHRLKDAVVDLEKYLTR